jgi:hypothetical protein
MEKEKKKEVPERYTNVSDNKTLYYRYKKKKMDKVRKYDRKTKELER